MSPLEQRSIWSPPLYSYVSQITFTDTIISQSLYSLLIIYSINHFFRWTINNFLVLCFKIFLPLYLKYFLFLCLFSFLFHFITEFFSYFKSFISFKSQTKYIWKRKFKETDVQETNSINESKNKQMIILSAALWSLRSMIAAILASVHSDSIVVFLPETEPTPKIKQT